jgi:hypothetical protein
VIVGVPVAYRDNHQFMEMVHPSALRGTMHLTVASPQLSYDLRLTGADHVMYAKDKLGIKGFIQAGAQEGPKLLLFAAA